LAGSGNIISRYSIIILAAGASVRLGKPKQLLAYNNVTLIQHAIGEALAATAEKVIVVLGSNAELISAKINAKEIYLVNNNGWQEGIGSSIRVGTQQALKISPSLDGLMIMVCDQPYVNASVLQNLVNAHHETGKLIIASNYMNTMGTPALFHKKFFSDLLTLEGDMGAKKILMQHKNDVHLVDFPFGHIDIDNNKDYELLLQK
jgi:molybdenum cofactor cytidylyltransferase